MIRNRSGFASRRTVIGPEIQRRFLNQSGTRLQPIATLLHVFSRASRSLPLCIQIPKKFRDIFLRSQKHLWFCETQSKNARGQRYLILLFSKQVGTELVQLGFSRVCVLEEPGLTILRTRGHLTVPT